MIAAPTLFSRRSAGQPDEDGGRYNRNMESGRMQFDHVLPTGTLDTAARAFGGHWHGPGTPGCGYEVLPPIMISVYQWLRAAATTTAARIYNNSVGFSRSSGSTALITGRRTALKRGTRCKLRQYAGLSGTDINWVPKTVFSIGWSPLVLPDG